MLRIRDCPLVSGPQRRVPGRGITVHVNNSTTMQSPHRHRRKAAEDCDQDIAKELMFHANFRDGSLYLGCKRGILLIDSVPMARASKFDLKSRQGPVWQECFPRLKLDRLFRVIDVLGLLDIRDSWTCPTGCIQRH